MPDGNDKKQNISLIIGLSIPVAMVVFIAFAINGARWFNTIAPPQHDFLYMSGEQDPYATYVVEDGRLIVKETTVPEGTSRTTTRPMRFFVHDVSENESAEISAEEALAMTLDGSIRSADGFSVETGRRGGWFIFGYGRDYRNRYLVNENYSEKLKVETHNSNYNYYRNFQFLGWVTGNE